MVSQVKNISASNQPIEIQLDSKYLVLIDMIVLDGLAGDFSASPDPISADPVEYLTPFSSPLRIGIYEIPEFTPGIYSFSVKDIIKADPDEPGSHVVYIDTGELVLVDFSHLSAVAKHLTWEQYDLYLQAQDDDDSIIKSINKKVGGAYFGILGADPDTEFDGDGCFKMKPGSGVRIRK